VRPRPWCLLLPLLASCSVAPTIITPGGSRITLGASVFEKSADESAAVTLPDGTQLAYTKRGKDQTAVAKEGIRAWATVAAIVESAKGLNEGEAIRERGATARELSSDSVRKASIEADVAKANFVPPE
jgi:hypothetical protein